MATQQDYIPQPGNSAAANQMLQFLLSASQGQGPSGADPNYQTQEEALTNQSSAAARQNIANYQAIGADQIAQNRDQYGSYKPHQGSGLVGQLLGNTLNEYVHGKLTKLQGEEDLKSQQTYLKAMPKDLTPTQQANYLQLGPTKDLQVTGNNMLQQMLGNQDAASYQQPKTITVGGSKPGTVQVQQLDPVTKTYFNVGPERSSLNQYAEENQQIKRTAAEQSKQQFEQNTALKTEDQKLQREKATRDQANFEVQQKNAAQNAAQQVHQNQVEQWKADNPTYAHDVEVIKSDTASHKQFVDSIDRYKAQLEKTDWIDRHNPLKNGDLQAARQAVTWGVRAKDMQNTGVMNKGEEGPLNQTLADPTEITGKGGYMSKADLIKQLDSLKSLSETFNKRTLEQRQPKSPFPKAPESGATGPQDATPKGLIPPVPANAKTGDIVVINGKKYRVGH